MHKPEVRVIQYQQEEVKQVDVSQSERDYLLSKYGYIQSSTTVQNDTFNGTSLSFEEMVELEEKKQKSIKDQRVNQIKNRAYSFDQVNYSESKYTSLDLEGSNYGIQVHIMSDMPINNNRR